MHPTLSSLLALCVAALFCSAAQGENGVLRFMMVGDWGGKSKKPHYTDAEMSVSEQMGKTAADIGANFTVAVGDNFYDDGVKDVDDKRFKETFEVRPDPSQGWFSRCGRTPSQIKRPLFYQKGPLFCLKKPQISQKVHYFVLKNTQLLKSSLTFLKRSTAQFCNHPVEVSDYRPED